MKLDRNLEENEGRGKYAILKLRQLELCREQTTFGGFTPRIQAAISVLEENGILDWGTVGTDSEFFLIRLKDKYALPALEAYAAAAEEDDFEWATEVRELAKRSGPYSQWCKKPD